MGQGFLDDAEHRIWFAAGTMPASGDSQTETF